MRVIKNTVIGIINLCLLVTALNAPNALAQQRTDITAEDLPKIAANTAKTNNPLDAITGGNHIPILDNRFRIDHEVEAITMVFFREYGSAPVVLVQPDGSKIYQYMNNTQGVTWFDAVNYDMITLQNPMRGPWQAVGQILPSSKIMVLTDLQLVTEHIPSPLFVGETLRIRAQLINDGAPMTFAPFSEAIRMTIDFRSSNDPDEPNFGGRPRTVAVFSDDGIGLDEVPKDGIFTGEFALDIPQGLWNGYAEVKTPMYNRSVITPDIRVLPNPIEVSVKPSDLVVGQGGAHTVYFRMDYTLFDVSSIMVDGVVRYPDGSSRPFVINEPSLTPRELSIPNETEGVFAVSGSIFVKTNSGRDVRIALPRTTFVVEPPPLEVYVPSPEEIALAEQAAAEEAAKLQAEKDAKLVKFALWINAIVLLVGVTVMLVVKWLLRRRSRKLETLTDDLLLDDDLIVEAQQPWYQKILSKLPFLQKRKKTPEGDEVSAT